MGTCKDSTTSLGRFVFAGNQVRPVVKLSQLQFCRAGAFALELGGTHVGVNFNWRRFGGHHSDGDTCPPSIFKGVCSPLEFISMCMCGVDHFLLGKG